MIKERVQKILQFALATAKLNDDWRSRELGPIHLIKYVYIADLAYAQAHDGQTFTGAPWSFYNFGPWAADVYNEIEPALTAIGADKKTIPSRFEDDFTRWSMPDTNEARELSEKIDIDWSAKLAVEHAVKKFGQDTEDLLHHVYNSIPMLLAAPDEYLDFKTVLVHKAPRPEPQPEKRTLSKGQMKRRDTKFASVREELARRRELKQTQRSEHAVDPDAPQYDEVFFQGLAILDEVAGVEVEAGEFTCSISVDFWKSKARYDPDIH